MAKTKKIMGQTVDQMNAKLDRALMHELWYGNSNELPLTKGAIKAELDKAGVSNRVGSKLQRRRALKKAASATKLKKTEANSKTA